MAVVGAPQQLAADLMVVMRRSSGETQRERAGEVAARSRDMYGRQLQLSAPAPAAPINLGGLGVGGDRVAQLQGGRRPDFSKPAAGDPAREAATAVLLGNLMTDGYLDSSGSFGHGMQLGDAPFGLLVPLALDCLEQTRCAPGAGP